MHGVEMPLDRLAVAAAKHAHRQIDGHGMFLADIAHVGRALDRDALRRHRRTRDGVASLLLQRAIDAFDLFE